MKNTKYCGIVNKRLLYIVIFQKRVPGAEESYEILEAEKMEHHILTDNLKNIISAIVNVEKNDINNENANMSSATPAGQMMRFASEISKIYALENLVSERFREAHEKGDIHIHDLDYYSTKTTTCLQYDLAPMFEKGFHTKHGYIREAKSISTYATLATIIFQTNQNEQHGGQSIPAFDFFLAKGVLKSFRRHFRYRILSFLSSEYIQEKNEQIKQFINRTVQSICPDDRTVDEIVTFLRSEEILRAENTHNFDEKKDCGKEISGEKTVSDEKMSLDKKIEIKVRRLLEIAYNDTRLETFQAMEGFLHNLNTMHSRGGNQVVFSSINYGTDTSAEGRMVIKELLKATEEGLGRKETPIFPIQIFKVKEGINFCGEDYKYAMENFDEALKYAEDDEKLNREKENIFKTPNFDLLLLSCKTTSRRLFPNYVFLDSEFNRNELWRADDPLKYRYEVATMGCRTRVFENVNGEKTSLGRGNLSFTSINFPRIAIKVRREAEEEIKNLKFRNGDERNEKKNELLKKKFHEKVKEMTYLAGEQLLERYSFQKTALGKQFPFMRSNDLWKGMNRIDGNDEVGDILNSGSLAIGFVGGSNAMYALFNEDHGKSALAYSTLYESIQIMEEIAQEFRSRYSLNYSILATPAESLAGRFLRMDRAEFGEIENVTDRNYYVNSFHIDVKENIGIFEKIRKEAPFHRLTKGGHITYVELDGEAKKNISVVLKIVKTMKDCEIGYGSINHPVDRCRDCGMETIMDEECPVCGSRNISKIRRITGYLTGDLESWNSAKKSEEKDRVKHGI